MEDFPLEKSENNACEIINIASDLLEKANACHSKTERKKLLSQVAVLETAAKNVLELHTET